MQVDREEFLRYLGWKGQETDDTFAQKLDEAAKHALGASEPRSAVRRFALTREFALAGTGFVLEGKDIRAHLAGCSAVFLMAATIGSAPERELMRLMRASAHAALLFDTACSCVIESYCDDICADLQQGCPTLLTPRFSCGYGDFPLQAQREICALLRTDARLGLCCDESFLLTPRKSVTAVIGITDIPYSPEKAPVRCGHKCAACGNAGCAFRKTE